MWEKPSDEQRQALIAHNEQSAFESGIAEKWSFRSKAATDSDLIRPFIVGL